MTTTQECTATGCDRPTEQYLCADCTRDLQAWIDLAPGYVDDLYLTMAKLDNVRPANMGGGNGATKPAPPAPINLDAAMLRTHLGNLRHTTAATLATDPNAAGIMALIIDWCTKAETLISGPEAENVDHAENQRRVHNIAPAMPTRQLLPWLREHARINLTSQVIRHYAMRGYIKPVERDPQPTYLPHEVLAAYNDHGKG